MPTEIERLRADVDELLVLRNIVTRLLERVAMLEGQSPVPIVIPTSYAADLTQTVAGTSTVDQTNA